MAKIFKIVKKPKLAANYKQEPQLPLKHQHQEISATGKRTPSYLQIKYL